MEQCAGSNMEAAARLFEKSSRQEVAVSKVAVRKRTGRRSLGQAAALTGPPKPTMARAEGLGEPTVDEEHLDAGPSPRIDIVKRLVLRARYRFGSNDRTCHGAVTLRFLRA